MMVEPTSEAVNRTGVLNRTTTILRTRELMRFSCRRGKQKQAALCQDVAPVVGLESASDWLRRSISLTGTTRLRLNA